MATWEIMLGVEAISAGISLGQCLCLCSARRRLQKILLLWIMNLA